MVIHALTTMFNRRQNLDKQIRRQVEAFFGPELVLETAIHKNVGIAIDTIPNLPGESCLRPEIRTS
jgi:hypothetical protein